MLLKNINTGSIGQFANLQGDDWLDITNLPEGAEYLLDRAKTSKIAQLDINRNNFCLIPIEYNNNTYATTINAWAAISYLANGLSALSTTAEYPNYPQGDNITLTKADFKNIAGLIQTREMFSRDKRKDLTTQINACTTIEEVEAININF